MAVDRFLIFEADLSAPEPPVACRIPIEIRELTVADTANFAGTFRGLGIDPAKMRARLLDADRGWVALDRGRLAHFRWLACSQIYLAEADATVSLAPPETLSYHAVTLPKWRGLGIAGAVLSAQNRYLRGAGFLRHFAVVPADNRPSIRSHARSGFSQLGSIWCVRLAGREASILWRVTRRHAGRFTRGLDALPLAAPDRHVPVRIDYRAGSEPPEQTGSASCA